MAIFDKLKNIFSSTAGVVTQDMKRLDKYGIDLSSTAAEYINNGSNETVLSSLAQKAVGTDLEVAEKWPREDITLARRAFLARSNPYDVDLCVRYAQVLGASQATPTDATTGSKYVTNSIRYYFTEVFSGLEGIKKIGTYTSNKELETNVTVEIALDVIEQLGGTVVDYFDCLYQETNEWSVTTGKEYREIVDIKPIVIKHSGDLIQATARLHAIGRSNVIKDLSKWGIATDEAFLDFILELAGDGSKAVREAATSSLKGVSASTLEAAAIAKLPKSKVAMRQSMVEILAGIGSESAFKALKEHRKIEKTARINSSIDTLFSVQQKATAVDLVSDDQEAYTAIDGSRVAIPSKLVPLTGETFELSDTQKRGLQDVISEQNEALKRQIAESKKNGYSWKPDLITSKDYNDIVNLFSFKATKLGRGNWYQYRFLEVGTGLKWTRAVIDLMPEENQLEVCLKILGGARGALWGYDNVFSSYLMNYMESDRGDLRYLEYLDIRAGATVDVGNWNNRVKRKIKSGDLLRSLISESGYFWAQPDTLPKAMLWPYLANHFEVFDEAFGMLPQPEDKLHTVYAIRFLSVLPKTPMRYFGPLLEAGTSTKKSGRSEARAMLDGVSEVDDRLIDLLNDSRQDVRASSAEWLAQRQSTSSVKFLKKRLNKEKSELARAAILTALSALGEDLTAYIGPKALVAEAEKNVAKANFDKLDWLGLDHLPALHFKNKKRVPREVPLWWIFLANKLKQPGGNKLFEIYLDQLTPVDAETLSNWILNSWVNFDTVHPSEDEANEHAKLHVKNRYQSWKKWIDGYTEDRAFADLRNEILSTYLNSASANKGILALATRATPSIAANQVRNYLKKHGSRTSQSSSLLQVLASMGDPVSLQVLISASTRLKQKSVQKLANDLLTDVAEVHGWTLDELSDRTIPTAGFNDVGVLDLPCGLENKAYRAILDDDLKITIQNPDLKTVKALSSGSDDNTKASKKQLSASRKELKQVVSMQASRLYEALCAERSWSISDWKAHFHDHPLMKRMIERIVWLGFDENGELISSFRPTAEGDFTDSEDGSVNIDEFHSIRIGHGALLKDGDDTLWATHLDDYEVTPLFVQFGRKLLAPDDDQARSKEIMDRKGWVTDTFTVRGAANKLGYERGESLDGGYFNEYIKIFKGANLSAVIEFSGNCLPEENVAAALISLRFDRLNKRMTRGSSVELKDVPPVLLSECWNDYYAMSKTAVFDKDWEKKMPWM